MQQLARAGLLTILAIALFGCDIWMSPERRLERVQQAMAKGDYRSASVDLRTVLQEREDDARARLLMAQVAMKLGDPETAQTQLRKAHSLGVKPDSTAELEVDVLLALGKFEDLLKGLQAGSIPLAEPLRSIALGRVQNGLQQYPAAVASFESALERAPTSEPAQAGLAEALGGSGNFARGLEVVGKLTQAGPEFAYGWLVQGQLQIRAGQFEAATASLQNADTVAFGQLNPRQLVVLHGLNVEANLARGNTAAAGQAQQKLAASGLNPVLATLLGARVLMAERKYDAAIDLLQPLVARVDDLAPARFMLGAALLADGRLEQAEHQLSQLVQAQPEHIEARKLLAQSRLRLSRASSAMEALMPALDNEDSDASVASLAAAASAQAGDTAGAIGLLESAVDREPKRVDTHLRLAQALIGRRQFARAIDVLQKMPAEYHAHPQRAALLLSAVALKDGTQAADRLADTLVNDSGKDVAIMNVVAAHYARRAEYARAKTYLAQVLETAPNDVGTQLHLARLHEATGNVDAARALLERVTEQDQRNVPAVLERARLAAQAGDAAGAVRVLEQGLSRMPQERALQIALTRQYYATNQSAKADELVSKMLAAEPQSAELNYALGQVYGDIAAYDRALARFMVAVTSAPDTLEYRFAVARTRLALGQNEGARLALNDILQRRADWTPAVATVALIDIREGRAAAAMDRAKAHATKHPNDPAALVLLGDVQMAARRYAEAADSYSRAAAVRDSALVAIKEAKARQLAAVDNIEAPLLRWLSRHPGDLMVHNALAEIFSRTGRANRAIAEYELIVGQRPRDAMALNNLAWLYFEAGDERAAPMAERAYRLAPHIAGIADTHGWLLVQRGQAAAAVTILEKAEANSNGQFEIAYHHAVALAKTGQTQAARQKLSALLKSQVRSPTRTAAEQLLARLDAH
ncbi:MAG: XrtA/PEP-CTERM system TPR-repeat protein PrsT [Steroidobacteraceae bacterium]